MTTVTRLEIGYPARSEADARSAFTTPPVSAMPVEYLTAAIEGRALQVQSMLAVKAQHRAPSIPELLVAAAAELARLTVLHMDKDFDLIAGITGQPMERLPCDAPTVRPAHLRRADARSGRPAGPRPANHRSWWPVVSWRRRRVPGRWSSGRR